MKFWHKYNVFVPTQFGFRENYSTSLAIAHLHELVINKLDKNNSICALFLDLAKAFDTVCHNIGYYYLNWNNMELEVLQMILSGHILQIASSLFREVASFPHN